MPISVYPSSPLPSVPYEWTTSRPIARSGPLWRPVTRALTRFDCPTVSLPYRNLPWADAMDLLVFWNGMGGANGIFMFIDLLGIGESPVGMAWENLYVCVGTGTTGSDGQAVWDLPCYAGTSHIVYVNGSVLSASHYTIDTTGTNGVDEITFNTGYIPTTAQIVSVTATCRRVMLQARFADDSFPLTAEEPFRLSGNIRIMEVR